MAEIVQRACAGTMGIQRRVCGDRARPGRDPAAPGIGGPAAVRRGHPGDGRAVLAEAGVENANDIRYGTGGPGLCDPGQSRDGGPAGKGE